MKSWQILLLATTIAFASATQKLVAEEFQLKRLPVMLLLDGKVSLFGGYNLFGTGAQAEKQFDSQVDHNELIINFDLYLLDSWDNETFKVYIEDDLVYSYKSLGDNAASARPVKCGDKGFTDTIKTVSISLPHFRREFTLKFISDLDSNARDESWGIRNLQILANYDTNLIKVVSEEFMQNDFKESTKGWELNDVTSGKEFTTCDGKKVFGGYNLFGKKSVAQRKLADLPDHFALIINFDLIIIDSWDANDSIQFSVDQQLNSLTLPKSYYPSERNYCQTTQFKSFKINISLVIPHRGTTASILSQGDFDEGKDNESYAFANFRVLAITTPTDSTKDALIKDLVDLTASSKVTGWYDTSIIGSATALNYCAGTHFLGPIKEDLIKTIKNLPSHNMVRIYIKVIAQGNWNNGKIRFVLNNAWVKATTSSDFVKTVVCSTANEQIRNIYIDVPHFSDTLEFRITANKFDQDTVYYVKDFILLPYTNPDAVISVQEFTGAEVNPDNWLINGSNNGKKVSTCGTINLLGGFQTFGKSTSVQRTFDIPQTHTYIRLTFSAYLIDTWDDDDFLSIYLEDELVKRIQKSTPWIGNFYMCGQTQYKEENILVDILLPHNKPTLKLTVKDNLNSDTTDESWGMRDITIQALNYRINPQNLNGGGSSFSVYQGKIDQCVKVYSACDYKGEMFPVCESVSDLQQSGWTKPIRSVFIPNGKVVSLYKQTGFAGDEKKISTSQACLSGQNFLLVNQAFNIDVTAEEEPKSRLRVQNSF